jgi:formate dehydrogenase subunit delta
VTGTLDNLVRMANQIAANLAHEPDPVAATAQHIRSFWDPRMRAMILAAPAGTLSPAAQSAIDRLRAP